MKTKEPQAGTRNAPSCLMANKELLSRLRNAVVHAPTDSEAAEHSARETIRDWLSLLAPPLPPEEKSLSKDLSLIGKVVSSIIEATEEKILTSEEADAITEFLVAKFVERRLEKTMRELFVPAGHHWFVAASRYFNE